MKKFSILFMSILILTTSTFYSCNDDEGNNIACEGISKADMLFDLMSLAESIIFPGNPFNITSIVENVADDVCETLGSDSHTNSYMSVFRDNPDSPWEQIDFIDSNGNTTNEASVATPDIAAGNNQPINIELTMDVPGKYMVLGESDSRNDVDERNETNNGAETNEGTLNGLWNPQTNESKSRTINESFLSNLIEGKDYIIIEVLPVDGVVYDKNTKPVIHLNSITLK